MIGGIQGQVVGKGLDWVLLHTSGGVSYKVAVTQAISSSVQLGDPLSLLTHLVVREDQLSLYGFMTEAELVFFSQLIGISGVGPRLALSVLNSGSVSDLKTAIASNNLAVLTMISGIGKKTAERILIELKNSLDVIANTSASDAEDLVSALIGLGYNAFEVRKVLTQLPTDLPSTEAKLKYALQQLGKN
jgi:Holliday junction DNA helicase RuvA